MGQTRLATTRSYSQSRTYEDRWKPRGYWLLATTACVLVGATAGFESSPATETAGASAQIAGVASLDAASAGGDHVRRADVVARDRPQLQQRLQGRRLSPGVSGVPPGDHGTTAQGQRHRYRRRCSHRPDLPRQLTRKFTDHGQRRGRRGVVRVGGGDIEDRYAGWRGWRRTEDHADAVHQRHAAPRWHQHRRRLALGDPQPQRGRPTPLDRDGGHRRQLADPAANASGVHPQQRHTGPHGRRGPHLRWRDLPRAGDLDPAYRQQRCKGQQPADGEHRRDHRDGQHPASSGTPPSTPPEAHAAHWIAHRAEARTDAAGWAANRPTTRTSGTSHGPPLAATSARTCVIRSRTSWAPVPGDTTMKLACLSETRAPPRRWPIHPAASTSRPAESPSGLVNTDPQLRSRSG